jgi:hypothetical protein
MHTQHAHTARDLAGIRSAVPSCSLDDVGLAEQQARYARLGTTVEAVRREAETVSVRFSPGFDRAALAELIAIERECCPFFEFVLDESRRTLRVAVPDAEHAPALDALAAQLGRGEGIRVGA